MTKGKRTLKVTGVALLGVARLTLSAVPAVATERGFGGPDRRSRRVHLYRDRAIEGRKKCTYKRPECTCSRPMRPDPVSSGLTTPDNTQSKLTAT